jgi:hypothetical protein
MSATYLLPAAAPCFASFTRALLLVAAGWLASLSAAAQAAGGPSPAAAAANADMVSWMARGLLSAVVVLTVLTCLVLLLVFTTGRRPDARPLAPSPAPATLPQAAMAA